MGHLIRWTLLFVACAGCPKPTLAPFSEPTTVSSEQDVFDEAALQRWAEELIPLVEKHGGRRFDAGPPVEFFTNAEFQSFAAQESKLIADALYRDTPPAVRERLADRESKVSIRGLFGKYGIFTGKVYLVREGIAAAAERKNLPASQLAKIVLAHELAHALQADQAGAPDTLFAGITDQDHFHGWSSVSEGGANYIARAVAEELGLLDVFWTMCTLQGWDEDGMQDPAAYDIWMRYGRGMEMFDDVVASGGMDAFWTWHDAPPASSAMLFRPDTYAPTVPERSFDYAAVLRGTDQELTRGDWLVTNSRLGEYVLRGEALRTGKEAEFEAVLDHLVGAQLLDLTMEGRTGDIRYLQFDGPEPARTYLHLLRAEQTVEGQHLAKSLGVTVEVTYADVNDIEGDASLLRTQRVPAGAGRFVETRTAWVVRGSDVVAVTANKFRPGLRLANTLNAVFDQLTEVRAEQP